MCFALLLNVLVLYYVYVYTHSIAVKQYNIAFYVNVYMDTHCRDIEDTQRLFSAAAQLGKEVEGMYEEF